MGNRKVLWGLGEKDPWLPNYMAYAYVFIQYFIFLCLAHNEDSENVTMAVPVIIKPKGTTKS